MINPELIMHEVTLENIKQTLMDWYDVQKHHYITINAIDSGENLTFDWIFSEYEVKNIMHVFRAENNAYKSTIPSMMDVYPSAWVSEWDLADMFNLNMENAHRGMFLEPEAPTGPLLKESYSGK